VSGEIERYGGEDGESGVRRVAGWWGGDGEFAVAGFAIRNDAARGKA
jgi:hypothetical protein